MPARGSADIIYRMLLTSKSRSRKEYVIPTDNIIVLDHFFNLTKKSYHIGKFCFIRLQRKYHMRLFLFAAAAGEFGGREIFRLAGHDKIALSTRQRMSWLGGHRAAKVCQTFLFAAIELHWFSWFFTTPVRDNDNLK